MTYYLIPLLLWLLAVTVMDFKYRKVKNILFIIGFLYTAAVVVFVEKFYLINHLCGALLIFLILLLLYFYNGMGAGDVKVGLVIGLFWGFSWSLLSAMLVAFIASMMHVFLFFFWKNGNVYFLGVAQLLGSKNLWFFQVLSKQMVASIPFAGYAAASTIFWMLYKSPP